MIKRSSKFDWQTILMAAVLVLLTSACTQQNSSPEDEIRHYIDAGIEAAENRNAGALADMIDERYQDQNGFNKAKIKSMLRFYFLRNKNIFLFKKIKQIKIASERTASVELFVAMAGRVINDASLLDSLRARVYRFELELTKPADDWLLQSARWQQASANEMQ